jgi:hypothetical protein
MTTCRCFHSIWRPILTNLFYHPTRVQQFGYCNSPCCHIKAHHVSKVPELPHREEQVLLSTWRNASQSKSTYGSRTLEAIVAAAAAAAAAVTPSMLGVPSASYTSSAPSHSAGAQVLNHECMACMA